MMDLFEYCPPKMLLPLHDALLDATSQEHRALAHQAADVLVPLLGRFLPPEPDGRPPAWIVRLRDALTAESHTTVHHVWALIGRRADVYYPYSGTLLPWLIQSLSRLSQSPVTVEMRRPSRTWPSSCSPGSSAAARRRLRRPPLPWLAARRLEGRPSQALWYPPCRHGTRRF